MTSTFPAEKSLSVPMGRDYIELGRDMEVNPLLIHNASLTFACCLQLKPKTRWNTK